MSRWLDFADELAAHLAATLPDCLETVPAGERVDVLVDRKLEIASTLAQVAAKARGAAIVILWNGARNPDRSAAVLRMGGSYTVFVITRPVLREGKTAPDDLVEQAAEAIHGWAPPRWIRRADRRLEVTDVDLAPHKSLLIYEISAEVMRLGN